MQEIIILEKKADIEFSWKGAVWRFLYKDIFLLTIS